MMWGQSSGRRRVASFFAGGVGVLMTVALAGCGADDASEGAAQELVPPPEGLVEYPLTLDSDAGEVVLEERPERIAVVDARPASTDILLEMGVVPILASTNLDFGGWVSADDLDQIERLWEVGDEPLATREEVAAAEPDLIVHFSNRELAADRAADFARIAPTVALVEGEQSWREMTALLAEALDLEQAGQQVVDSVDDAIAESRSALAAHHGATITQLHVHAGQNLVFITTPGRDASELYESLGFELSAAAASVPEDGAISLENIGMVDADLLFVTSFAQADVDPILDAPVFQALPVVAEERVFFEIGDAPDARGVSVGWALSAMTPTGLKAALPILVDDALQALS